MPKKRSKDQQDGSRQRETETLKEQLQLGDEVDDALLEAWLQDLEQGEEKGLRQIASSAPHAGGEVVDVPSPRGEAGGRHEDTGPLAEDMEAGVTEEPAEAEEGVPAPPLDPLADAGEAAADSPRGPGAGSAPLARRLRVVFCALLLLVAASAGFEAARLMHPGAAPPTGPPAATAAVVWPRSVYEGLFLPLERGNRTLYLSMALGARFAGRDGSAGAADHRIRAALCEVVRNLSAEQLRGYRGMRSLKEMLLDALHRRIPKLRIKEIYFSDYLIL